MKRNQRYYVKQWMELVKKNPHDSKFATEGDQHNPDFLVVSNSLFEKGEVPKKIQVIMVVGGSKQTSVETLG